METGPAYISLIHKELTHQLTPEEAAKLKAWLAEGEQHRLFREEIRRSWELAGTELPQVGEPEIEAELNRLQQRISNKPAQEPETVPFRKQVFYKMLAAVLLLTIALGSLLFLHRSDEGDAASVFYTTTSQEGDREILLPDSSKVFVRGATDLSFQQTRHYREVFLSGQAFFQVARDEQLPFKIYLKGMTVKVLGTSFFVKAVAGEPLEVSVESGRVEVQHQGQRFLLKKGQQLRIAQGEPPHLEDKRDVNYLSWRSRKLLFRQTPLQEVLPALERHYGVAFEVANTEILSCSFTGTFEEVALDDLMEIVSYSLQISVEKLENHKFRLSGKGCP